MNEAKADCEPEKMDLASAATMALQTARLAAKTSKKSAPGQLGYFSFSI